MAALDQLVSATRGVFGSTAGAVGELKAADDVLRTPLPLSRRVGFVSVAGGSGTTSALTSVASLLAQRRAGMVLAADASGGRSGSAQQLLGVGAAGARGPDDGDEARAATDRRRRARTAADARAGLEQTSSGLHLLQTPVLVSDWADEVGPIVRFFDLVFTDWGMRPPTVDLDEVAGSGHLLVLVARAERGPAIAAARAIDALTGSEAAPHCLLTLVDVGHNSDRLADGLSRSLGVPVLGLPWERARGRRITPTSRDFAAATRTAHIRLAAEIMRQVIASQSTGARMPVRVGRTAPDQPVQPERQETPLRPETDGAPRHGAGVSAP